MELFFWCIVFVLAAVASLYAFQGSLIYRYTRYGEEHKDDLSRVARLDYQTSQGRQSAFFLPPTSPIEQSSLVLWVVFNGNAAPALEWIGPLLSANRQTVGILFVDYPGYGLCEGKASPATILENSISSIQSLAVHLHLSPQKLTANLNLLGLSLGTAAASQLAAVYLPKQLVLIAPFTSLVDMARRQYGWPLCNLLVHRFDNVLSLTNLATWNANTQVAIFHGEKDELIPPEMSIQLGAVLGEKVRVTIVKCADHDNIVSLITQDLRAIISNSSDKKLFSEL